MFINPYEGIDLLKGYQRVNFHTHAGTGPNTCGSIALDDVISEYQRLGYGGLCVSNHNKYTDPTTYQNRYDLCLLDGYEYTVKNTHMLCIGTKQVVLNSPQDAINSAINDGGFAIICHPNWKFDWSFPKDLLDTLHGFVGIEIYNGSIDTGPVWNREGSNGRCNAPEAFDYLLSSGRLCWCFGNDDFHRWWYLGRAWNMVFSDRTREGIAASVKKGAFYVSTGLILENFELKQNCLYVKARNSDAYHDTYQYRFIGKDGKILQQCSASESQFVLSEDELYVRVEVMNTAGKMLYTQPVYSDAVFRSPAENML